MGSSLTSCRQTNTGTHFLIGDLSQFSAANQKLFKLCEQVLKTSKNDSTFQKTESYQPLASGSEVIGENSQVTDTNGKKCPNDLDNGLVIDSIGIKDGILFIPLPLKKKLYMTQTFVQWKIAFGYEMFLSCCKSRKRTIYIQPVDNFPDFIKDFEIKLENYRHSLNFLTFLQTFAEIFFSGMTIRVLPNFILTKSKWNITSRVHPKTGQKQYLVSDFFIKLSRVMPPDGYCIMGIVWTDLYPCEALNFVLGEASNMHKAGIHCFGRYEPKTYDAENHQDIIDVDGKLIWRLIKVS